MRFCRSDLDVSIREFVYGCCADHVNGLFQTETIDRAAMHSIILKFALYQFLSVFLKKGGLLGHCLVVPYSLLYIFLEIWTGVYANLMQQFFAGTPFAAAILQTPEHKFPSHLYGEVVLPNYALRTT